MSEIERAIEELEVMRKEYNRPCGQMQSIVDKNQRRINVIRLCKSILRAELEREKNPLTCDGCRWRGRHQKCSCCRRNRSMRDAWEEAAVDGNV